METQQNIEERLTKLERTMQEIKEHIEDVTLTDEEIALLKKADKEYEEGETTSIEDLKKELDL